MATKTFTSFVELNNHFEKACGIAVKNTANIALEKLKELIQSEYYDLYEPHVYKRTYQFLNSAVANILSVNSAEVKMDADLMNYTASYRYLDGSKGTWTGEDQLYMADAGYHGNVNIYRDGHFWREFESWCNDNILQTLRKELKKQGINVIK